MAGQGKWTARGKVRATSFNRVTRDGSGNPGDTSAETWELKESAVLRLLGTGEPAGASQA